jgi:hypothetical protein
MENVELAMLEALKKIRTIGYDSKITRTPETVLRLVRIAEDAILKAERAARQEESPIERPYGIPLSVWNNPSYTDRRHWQNCVIAAVNARSQQDCDISKTARNIYLSQGGHVAMCGVEVRKPLTGDQAEAAGRQAFSEACREVEHELANSPNKDAVKESR